MALTAAALSFGEATAHGLGAMKVTADFSKDGGYRIEAVLDLEHLPAGIGNRDEVTHRLRDDSRVAFDGVEVALHAEPGAPGPHSPSVVSVRFAGTVPAGAKTFTWRHGLVPGPYLLGVRHEEDGEPTWLWVEGPAASEPYPLRHAPRALGRLDVVGLYLGLGFTHIVPRGLDHILFVLGLFFLSVRPRTILAQVTAFTIAHSITLGLGIYGVVALDPRLVEPLIALSIVYVTVENLLLTEVRAWRVGVVFCFGLLHGMGFAGVLRELGLPRSEFLTALLSFNVGVEAGQLAVIGLAYLGVGLWFGRKSWYRAYVTVPASFLIATVGLYWTVQRVFFY